MSDYAATFTEASLNARQVDHIFLAVLTIAGAIFLLLVVLIVVFLIRYRRGSDTPRGELPKLLQREIEIGWTLATVFLALFIFWWFVGGISLPSRNDPNQLEIHVVAKQWMWKTEHPGGAREINGLHIPVGKPIRLVMTSQDVIHSFYVPAFRVKQDVLPGRSTELVFTPTKTGEFHLLCAEYCGTEHSRMTGTVVVMPAADYPGWKAAQPQGDTILETGEALYARLGCDACHSETSQVAAPKLAGLWGRMVTLQDGRRIVADETYIKRSITHPRDDIVAGFNPVMPSYGSLLDAHDLDALTAYLKSLPPQGPLP